MKDRSHHRVTGRFVAISLVTFLIVTAFASDASARHIKATKRNSVPKLEWQGPDVFECLWVEKPGVHQYMCESHDGGETFALEKYLEQGDPPPDPDVLDLSTLAIPDKFNCLFTGDPATARTTDHIECTYRHRHSSHGPIHTHRFLLSRAEFVTLEDDPSAPVGQPTAIWVLPHPAKKAHHAKAQPAKKAHHAKKPAYTRTAHHAKRAHYRSAYHWKKAHSRHAYHARRAQTWQPHHPCRGR